MVRYEKEGGELSGVGRVCVCHNYWGVALWFNTPQLAAAVKGHDDESINRYKKSSNFCGAKILFGET
jgi:hypothetical protein